MSTAPRGIAELIRESRLAVRDAVGRSCAARGWELLQERDTDGSVRGALPYTDEAFREFEAAHRHDPEDVGVIHHLAIGHHARAWDLELRRDPRAASEWEVALGFWRAVVASGAFWSRLEEKLLQVHSQADRGTIAELRRGLLEQLLEVHVGFVRQYCEAGTPERATDHVRIVQRASIPPAVKRRLVEKVFAAMTSGVMEARAARDFASALTPLERFLTLFPDYLHALRLHAEVCKDWVSGMSFRDDWEAIVEVSDRAFPHAERLATHAELATEPLARTAFEELAFELALRGHDRGVSYFASHESGREGGPDRQAARSALELSIRWARLAAPRSCEGATIKDVLAACALGYAFTLREEIVEVLGSDADNQTRLNAALGLARRAITEMEEALRWKQDLEDLVRYCSDLRDLLGKLEGDKQRLDLHRRMGGWG